jgi:glutamate carboxypeptidase
MTTSRERRAPELSEMLADLAILVDIDSPSRDVNALRESSRAVGSLLERRLGTPATYVPTEVGDHVRWSSGSRPLVLVLGHHDTVFPHGTVAKRPFTVDGDRATGPGVFDMLGGLVHAVHGLASLETLDGVEILVTADEEVGSHASRALIEELARQCEAVLVFEGAGEGGALKTGRKGCGTYRVEVLGRAAHAGLEPELGVNALLHAAELLPHLAALSRPAEGTTVTPTMARAGTADNAVPDLCELWVDVRVSHEAEKTRVEAAFESLEDRTDITVRVEGGIGRPPMPPEQSAPLVDIVRAVDPGVATVSVGGGSDGNFTAAVGTPTLDGLGSVGGGAHTDHEWIEIPAMVPRAHLVSHLVGTLQSASSPAGHRRAPLPLAAPPVDGGTGSARSIGRGDGDA